MAHNAIHYNKVEKVLDLRQNADTGLYEVQCKWIGFDHEEPTWEPFAHMMEDIPGMMKKFPSTFPNQHLVEGARSTL